LRGVDGLSDDELNDIEARALVASEGPWRSAAGPADDPEAGEALILTAANHNPPYLYLRTNTGDQVTPQDFDFIANARQDVPSLVAEVRRLRGLLAENL